MKRSFKKFNSAAPGFPFFLQGYASDCEKALRNVLARSYPHTAAYICAIHGKENISEQCSKLGLSFHLSHQIKQDIFGPSGLVFTKSRAEFEEVFITESAMAGTRSC